MIVTSALIIWKALMCITGSESPVVVVLSGSMEPGFKRVSLSSREMFNYLYHFKTISVSMGGKLLTRLVLNRRR